MPLITLTTDFGTRDFFVAALKGVLLSHCRGATLVDLSHDIPPGAVAEASFLLEAAAETFPAGTVHLAVVDPGVGSARELLGVRLEDAIFLAPDNGLLTPFLVPRAEIRGVDSPDLYRAASGSTFHGRDRFAPVAAWLAAGGAFAEIGPRLEEPVRLEITPPRRLDGRVEGRIRHIDRFGNLITDIPSTWLSAGAALSVEVGEHRLSRQAVCYAELEPGEPAVLPGSLGTLELALNREALANNWGIAVGTPVVLRQSRS